MSDLEFKVSAGLKDIIGRDLITDDFIAVFELVKNSYDANARNVVIEFLSDKIIISDDGDGMSLSDIKDKWLCVAYSSKKQETGKNYRDRIQRRRHYAGAKGIGRFSADRLGDDLILFSKTAESDLVEQIKVNWDSFNDQTQKFESVKIPHQQLNKSLVQFPGESPKGTILEISGITGWDRDKKRSLKHSLEKLINPFSESTDFNIDIKSPDEIEKDKSETLDRFKVNGPVKNAVLDILKIKTTHISVEITQEKIETRLTDRGALIYDISEKNKDFKLIDELKIDLYYLNTSAKNNFTRNMGIEPVNFGSVFLFKNGFRVQPYGQTGDDSWGLDYRAQQGYARFLGTRNLFGRVEITSDDSKEFKEVSSRDGGLVKTLGYYQLKEAFEEKGLKRLERYVVGVLWGEGFKKKNYFGQEEIADAYRKELLKNDQESDDISVASSNLGSKIDFIQLIKSLSLDEDIRINDFNKELVNLVNEKLDDLQTKFVADLEKIAEKINNPVLDEIIENTERRYNEILAEKELAEKRAQEEEKKRIQAEERALREEKARIEAERVAQEESDKRRIAELETLKKEKERAEAELARIKAEQLAKDQLAARRIAEVNLKLEKEKNTYLSATRKTLSEDAEDLIHSLKVSAIGIDAGLEKILRRLRDENSTDKVLLAEIGNLKFITDKVMKISKLITKSNFKADQEVTKVNVSKYLEEYINTYSFALEDKINIKFQGNSDFETRISMLDLSIVLDNLISNSNKAGAKNILVEVADDENQLTVLFHDDGNGVSEEFQYTPEVMFELGIKSNMEGSGIGLSTVKRKMKEMYGTIEFVGNNQKMKGATFKLIFE